MNKEFTEERDTPFKRVDPHEELITLWENSIQQIFGGVHKREDNGNVPYDVVVIRVPRKDAGARLMEPPIIELKFEKDTLDHT